MNSREIQVVEQQHEGNEIDQHDMNRMGKIQQLRREFHLFSILGYGVILGVSWEFALINGVLSLPNGGTAGSIWMSLISALGMFFVTLSMSEMASIAPTAGGQYHWCSEFAPKRFEKFLSYYVGFFCVLGWQVNLAGTVYASASQINAMIVVAHPSYIIQSWQTTIISWAILALAVVCNTVLFRKLPQIEGLLFILHIFGFVAVIAVLWLMAPRGDAMETITTFQSNGWSSPGLACLVGLNAAVGNNIGADSSVHLAEELHNASWALPRSMIGAATLNYIVSLAMTITFMFCLGDYNSVVDSKTGQPYVQVILNATQSKGGTIVLVTVLTIMTTASSINAPATISRQLWSFARDGALPASTWIAKVQRRFVLPMNAILVSVTLSVILTAIAIGSSVAYNIFVSLGISGLLTSYLICIACILYQRLSRDLPASRFDLGKMGNVVNGIAIAFLLVALTFQFFPFAPNPDAKDMNWSVVIYVAAVGFFTAFYFLIARDRYVGPVAYVRQRDTGGIIREK